MVRLGSGINLEDAVLMNTDFDHAVLSDASLQGANLNYAFSEMRTSLARTWLARTSPRPLSTRQCCANGSTPTEPQRGYNCSAN